MRSATSTISMVTVVLLTAVHSVHLNLLHSPCCFQANTIAKVIVILHNLGMMYQKQNETFSKRWKFGGIADLLVYMIPITAHFYEGDYRSALVIPREAARKWHINPYNQAFWVSGKPDTGTLVI